MKDYYQILGVQEDAPDDAIKKSYRKLAMEYHPDRNPNNQAAEIKFKEVQEAYDTLSDTNKRSQYDHMRKFGEQSSPFGFGDIFNNFVRRHEADIGQNIKTEISCTFEESLRGVKKTINISTNEICTQCKGSGCKGSHQKKNCSKCNGKGRVVVRQSPAVGVIFTSEKICDACGGQGNYIDPQNKCTDCSDGLKTINKHISIDIPPRTVFGSVLRIIQQGSLRKPHGKRGDCFIQIVPENHELFKIATKTEDDELVQNHEFNLLLEVPITLSQAIKGCNLKVPLLDRVYDFEIPALVDAKFSKKIIGAGLYQNHGGRCDIIIKIIIEINKNINSLGFAEILEKNEGEESNPKSFDMQRKMKQQKERMQNG